MKKICSNCNIKKSSDRFDKGRRQCKDCRRRIRFPRQDTSPKVDPDEKFKPVIGTNGLYEIGNFGTIKSFGRDRSDKKIFTLLRQDVNKQGYKTCVFKINSKRKIKKPHRLVALYFIKNKKNKPQVNHKDGDKTNNHYKNLEWATNGENQKHAFAIGLQNNQGENHPSNKLCEKEVVDIFYSTGDTKNTAKKYGISLCHTNNIKAGKVWKHLNLKRAI